MFYEFTKKELKEKRGIDFKDMDWIDIENRYTIIISYKGVNALDGSVRMVRNPALCSKVLINKTNKYQDIVFRPDYITRFLSRK